MENAEVARVLAEIADLLEPKAAQAIREGPGIVDLAGLELASEDPVAISTDAREATHLGNLRDGARVARRGWVETEDVLNTMPLAELRRRFQRKGAPARRAPGR